MTRLIRRTSRLARLIRSLDPVAERHDSLSGHCLEQPRRCNHVADGSHDGGAQHSNENQRTKSGLGDHDRFVRKELVWFTALSQHAVMG